MIRQLLNYYIDIYIKVYVAKDGISQVRLINYKRL